MDKLTLTQQALQIATPGYIFDLDLFRDRVKLVRRAFGEKVGLCFSIKANPFLLKYLPEEFDRIEVCSPGELSVCDEKHLVCLTDYSLLMRDYDYRAVLYITSHVLEYPDKVLETPEVDACLWLVENAQLCSARKQSRDLYAL